MTTRRPLLHAHATVCSGSPLIEIAGWRDQSGQPLQQATSADLSGMRVGTISRLQTASTH